MHEAARAVARWFQPKNSVALAQVLQRVSHEQPRRTGHVALDAVLEDGLADLGVKRAQRVVEQHDVRAAVGGARDGHALLLAPAEVDSALADLGRVACRQDGQVGAQRARIKHGLVGGLARRFGETAADAMHLARKNDVAPDACVQNPSRLRHVGNSAANNDAAAVGNLRQLAKNRAYERRLARADGADNGPQLALRHTEVDVAQCRAELGFR